MQKLVLFDIDGTLLNGGRLWREIFENAFSKVFPGFEFPKVFFSGKTDRQICAEVLRDIRWEDSYCAECSASGGCITRERELAIDRLIGAYLKELAHAVESGRASREVEVFSGVHELLKALQAEQRIRLGLLTGNIKEGAFLKLSAVGLQDYFWDHSRKGFRAGAFGDDHADRYQLPAIAVKRAKEEWGAQYLGKQVVIIGDTPHDVNCGKSIGVCSIAMGTGSPGYREALLRAGPDHYFDTFADQAGLLRAIGSIEVT